MLLNDVVDDNYNIEKIDVNNVNDYKESIDKKDERIIKEEQERIKNKQDIKDGIIKDIDHLNYIENLKDYSFNDNMRISIELPYDLMLDFHKSIELKYGCNDPMSKNVMTLISKFNESFLGEKQQHVTSSFLKYNGREPRLDVLLKLKRIVNALYEYNFDGFVHKNIVKQAISEELNADQRTADNYFITIRDFVEKMMDEKTKQYRDWNLMGLQEAIEEKLREKSVN
jgi:hypothetical protein